MLPVIIPLVIVWRIDGSKTTSVSPVWWAGENKKFEGG
jgi:hypothetical protein